MQSEQEKFLKWVGETYDKEIFDLCGSILAKEKIRPFEPLQVLTEAILEANKDRFEMARKLLDMPFNSP